jgi:hypothetical protein
MAGKFGVGPQQLEDAALERELRYLYGTRAETFVHGSRLALLKHTERILQLGQEDASRFPTGPGPTACEPARAPGPGRASRSGGHPRPGPSR